MKIRITGGLNVENLVRSLFTRPAPTPVPDRQPVPPPILLRAENKMRRAGSAEISEIKEVRSARITPLDRVPEQAPVPVLAPAPTPAMALAPAPAQAEEQSQRFQNGSGLLTRALNWVRTRQSARSRGKRLHVGASVSLGEKRFVAVIQVDGQQFLVGGGATNVTLLAQLNGKENFGDLLSQSMAVDGKPFGELTTAHAGMQA
jgi:hypothetical protein